ncbi:Uncharacterised protein [Bordetella pertussis]|nr:Uncharacterised protein [Bordetella pertussis]
MGVSAFLPMFRPRILPCERHWLRCTLAMKASSPWLLKPRRLISALARGSRNMRGLGLPGWARGVTVPTSTKPKPRLPSASMWAPFLSRPAASPTGLRSDRPISVAGASGWACSSLRVRPQS